MGLFGGKSSSKTEVKPDSRVEKLLKGIADTTNNMDMGSYIQHQYAGLNDNQNAALQGLSNNFDLNQVQQMLSGRTQQGLGQLGNSNDQLNQVLNNNVGASDVRGFGNDIMGSGTAKIANQQAANKGGLSALGNSGALRAANRNNVQNNAAMTNLGREQQARNMGINTMMGNNQASIANANMGSNIAGANLGLGMQGMQAGQQATQNQLNAGNLMQQQAQAEANNNWQNAMGAQQFDWNNLNNKLNVLNSLSPMAGYTAENTKAAISPFQQALGAGMTGLGIYGSMGGFQSGNALSSGKVGGTGANTPVYANQFSNQGGTGMFNQVANWFK